MVRRMTTKHLMTNAPTIIQEFGMLAFVRCLAQAMLKRKATFAELVMDLHRA
jgi:hypothetical protein